MPRTLLFCASMFAMIGAGSAYAQTEQEKLFDAKPFIPRIIPLPPNAQVTPGTVTQTPVLGDPAPINNPQTPPPASGLRMTIPMR
jgi:hypothetical protein